MHTPQPRSILWTALLVAGLAAGPATLPLAAEPPMLGVSPILTKYVDPLPVPPAATPRFVRGFSELADYYEIAMTQHQHRFHSELGPATVWTYGMKGQPGIYLGPTIVAHRDRPVIVKWINQLPNDPNTFPLKDSIDPTIMGADLPTGRAIPHLHGGKTAARFDGTPGQWWTATGQKGPDFVTDTFTYTNEQPAALLWYHDHSMGATRFNPYLGLAAAYLIFDKVDTGTTINGQKVPSGNYHLPIVLQDKVFNSDGTLFYPTQGNNSVHPIWVPEFFGDTPVINGKAYPRLDAEPRRYRLRLLNGSQARFYDLTFDHDGTALPFHVIGSEQGLLPAAVPKTNLLIAPGERFDVIVDFTGLPLGTKITVKNSALAPYPDGGMSDIPELMQIAVNTPLAGADLSVPAAALKLPAVPRLIPTPHLAHREVVGQETADPATDTPIGVKFNGYGSMDPTTDFIKAGSTETWEWINLTGDAHPMHIHLVSFQVLDRQPFDVDGYEAAWDAYLASGRLPALKPVLSSFLTLGPPVPPAPEEMGGKDTVKAYPGFVTRVRAKFDLPWTSVLDMDFRTRTFGTYVYHCHILEHEENDMMRPFEITF
ncbi:spore coat protein [Geothrix oryzae]|uniref:Spore coat protein n=1 Tax=Geothrix oryzae TaxID=2927975 RepID=A0ABN6V169_9BACT|nr:multicopper oxidase [Geothrix oryzae]BDU70601.1 spore coat protein [Geothrix oryzae]